ncbi:MAG: threonine synthase [Alphaproteobacteria bacterium]|nr:threonine synthase [Alphaproteobacteria bacterium]
MRYISTRGGDAVPDFESVVARGLASDGGLFVPETWPQFSVDELRKLSTLSYIQLAQRIMQPFVGDSLSAGELAALVQDTYAGFDHPDVVPLTKVDDQLSLLELFHGTTLAFKDVALQFLGRVFGHFTYKHGGSMTVIGATSGDTGSAAIEGCRGIPGIKVIILYPHNRPSEVQRRQMTCVDAPNVFAVALEGSFDDCQALVKQAFNNQELRKKHTLTAVNSINWARILAQVVYYFYAGLKAGALEKPVNFVVPTGNFGNVFAGHVAKKMGLPIHRLVIATNKNDSMTKFIETGLMTSGVVSPSLSPSMDIQIASNAERYLYELLNEDAGQVKAAMQQIAAHKDVQLPSAAHSMLKNEFMASSVSDEDTKATIKAVWEKHGILLDPHTAVGVTIANRFRSQLPGQIISLACAHPAKFPEIVREVTGQNPPLPPHLADLYQRPERFTVMPNDYAAFVNFIETR